MPLLKLLHFAALLCWCGSLLYLPAMIAAGTKRSEQLFYRNHAHLTRMVFTLISAHRPRYWPLGPARHCSCVTAPSPAG